MQRNVEKRAQSYKKAKSGRRVWRWIVTALACVVVFCTTYALILPAITMQSYTCGMEEHTHTEACYEQLSQPTTGEALTCTETAEDHVHVEACYAEEATQAPILTCTLPEHTHTEDCKPSGLDASQQQQVTELIQKIDALPTNDEIDATLAELSGDEDGEIAYLEPLFAQVQAVYKQYVAIGEALQSHISNADKLMELEWIWSVSTYAEENTGKDILDWPSINHVYISSLTLNRRVTGEGWFDEDAAAFAEGLDLSADDDVLRTYDMATYTIDFTTMLRTPEELMDTYRDEYRRLNTYKSTKVDVEEAAQKRVDSVANVGGYKNCYAYFEFAVPGTAEEVYFEQDSMPWLKNEGNFAQVYSVNLDLDHDPQGIAEPYQILKGRVLLTADANSVIGASAHQLYFCFRALNLKHDDTLQPRMCVSLMFNNAQDRASGGAMHIGTIDSQAFADADGKNINWADISSKTVNGVKKYYWKDDSKLYDTQLRAYWANCMQYRRFVIGNVTVANGGSLTKENSFVSTTHTDCPYCDADLDWDFCDARGLIFNELEISCKPRYNVALVSITKSRVGDFNFRETANTNAINYDLYSDDNASIQGRLLNYGIRLEIVGERDKGIIGVELPDPNEPLTLEFDVSFRSQLVSGGKTIDTEGTSYELLYWSGGENQTDGSYQGQRLPYDSYSGSLRPASVKWFNEDQRMTYYAADQSYRTFVNELPYNRQISSSTATNDANSCEEGGVWRFAVNDDGSLHCTVSGAMLVNNTVDFTPELLPDGGSFTGDSNSILPFPTAGLNYTANAVHYYSYKDADGNMMEHYWDLGNPKVINNTSANVKISDPRIVFSVGELWFVQPYTGIPETEEASVPVASSQLVGGSCDTKATVETGNLQVYSGTDENKTLITQQQVSDDDDLINKSYTYINSGTIYSYISYNVANATGSQSPIAGAYNEDADWVVKGQEFTVCNMISHNLAEGDMIGMAYDVLIKLDGSFMELREDDDVKFKPASAEFGVHFGEYSYLSSIQKNILYAAKPDGTTWQSTEEMKQYTIDDLVYYDSYDAFLASGDVLCGVLAEFRGRQTGQNIHLFLDVVAKQSAEAGCVYMVTRNNYVWRMCDVAEGAMAWWNATYPDKAVSDLTSVTEQMCNAFVKSNAFPSKARGSTMLNAETINALGKDAYHSDYAGVEPFWRQDYYVTHGSGMVSGSNVKKNTLDLAHCGPASYNAYGYVPGVYAYTCQDSCLLLDYKPTITKTVAQTDDNGVKQVFSMDTGQRYVDYVLQPGISDLPAAENSEGDTTQTLTLIVKDVLPAGLSYMTDSAYLGGSYTQSAGCRQMGTVTGGQQFTPEISVIPANDPEFPNDQGKTLLTFVINVTIDLANPADISIPPIYFSCKIGQAGAADDVADQMILSNKAVIRDASAELIPYSTEKGNLSVANIQISKLENYAISKLAKKRILETTESAYFTLTLDNPSSYPLENQLIVDELPYDASAVDYSAAHAKYGSFNGTSIEAGWPEITELWVGVEGTDAAAAEAAAVLKENIQVWYSGYPAMFRNYTPEQWTTDFVTNKAVDENGNYIYVYEDENGNTVETTEYAEGRTHKGTGWGRVSWSTATSNMVVQDGNTYYKLKVPTMRSLQRSIPYLAFVGTIPAHTTVKIHIGLTIIDSSVTSVSASMPAMANGGDTLVNYMYKYVGTAEDTTVLVSSDWVQYADRSLEGVTWIDSNANAMKDLSEAALPGVKVSLYKLKAGGTASNLADYEPVMLSLGEQAQIYVGQQLSLNSASTMQAQPYQATSGQNWTNARYRFLDVPAGTYAVKFTDPDGQVIIKPMLATAANYSGIADTLDSDGIAYYNDAKDQLEYTVILGIEMPATGKMQYGNFVSANHDSGFYNRGYVLPDTGGPGTKWYTWAGLLLVISSMAVLLYKPKRRREDGSSP